MITLLITLLKRKWICLVLLTFLACDSFKDDFIEPANLIEFTQLQYYILPGLSTVIDLRSVIKKSFIDVSLIISENPKKGTLTEMDAFVLKYTPVVDFSDGKDQFVFSAVLDDGTTLVNETITVHMIVSEKDFPCGVYAVEDNVRLKSSSTASVHVLENDHVCGRTGPVSAFIHLAPKFGDAVVVGDSIIYTPGASFSESDELVYGLSASTGEVVSFGLVSFNKRKVEVLDIQSSFKDIFFVDEMTGFISGENEIYKTTNGGKNWSSLFFPTGGEDLLDFHEIYFLDKDTGFAAFSRCWFADVCWGGSMVTTNGGESWRRADLDEPVNSIFFTSSLTGFRSSSRQDYFYPLFYHTIFKTIDGGETWDEAFNTISEHGQLNIRFATDLVGYAYDANGIYTTTDGGESWTRSMDNNFVTSFAITSKDVICAGLSSGLSVTTPGTIVRAENGETWKPVISFPYAILSQGFSPDGALGIAIGISGSNPSVDPASQILTISESTDQGKTWVDLTEQLDGFPLEISVPSSNVAYILCSDKIIKYSR
ncbi:MAG TPA: hypothetical protein VF141_04575 [Chryseolinea sp.]